jgi:hypothetical protein
MADFVIRVYNWILPAGNWIQNAIDTAGFWLFRIGMIFIPAFSGSDPVYGFLGLFK